MANFDVVIEPPALAVAALTPTAGWASANLPVPATVDLSMSLLEYRCLMKRSYRQLVSHSGVAAARQTGETLQQWCDRLFAMAGGDVAWPGGTRPTTARGTSPNSPRHLLHAMAVAFSNGVTT